MTENDIDNEKSDEAEAGVNSRKRGYSFPRHFGEIFLSVICTAALFAMYVIWLKGQQEIKPGSFAASALSVFLFTSIGTVFIFRWFDDFRRCGEHVRKPEPKLLCDAASAYRNDGTVNFQAVKVFFTLVLVDVAVIVFIAVFRYILGYHDSFFDGLKIWRMLDSQHYLYIAEHWYTAEGNYGDIVKIVFLPGYPVLVAAVRFIVRDYLAAGLIVSGICFAGAGALLYLLMRLDCGHDEAIRAVKFMCLIPGAFFFTAPMSESLFLLTTLAAVYFARRRKFFVSACFGFYAAFTRSLGMLCIIPAIYELIRFTIMQPPRDSRGILKRVLEFAYSLIIPCGFGAYCFINYLVAGDAFKFMEYQKNHWGQQISYFFNTACYEVEYFGRYIQNGDYNVAIALWGMGLFAFFGALTLLLAASKRLRPSYMGYSIIYFAVAMGATWLLSGVRYMAGMFTLPVCLAQLTRKKWAEDTAVIFLVLVYVIYAMMFINRWQVW